MRRLLVFLGVFAVVWVPGVASADVIFDQADADELAATLAEAYDAQNVCYGWSIAVDNEGVPETSVGSNFGAGRSVSDGDCAKSVEFQASITWTSESSESEDSASYTVVSTPSGPTTDDLDGLDLISEDGLVGDNGDADVYKAVAALPLLAADTGVADPIEASPAPESDAGDAAPTNSPGSDFWRGSGMQILWGSVILLAGVVFAWYAITTSRRPARRRTIGPVAEQIPEYVPEDWSTTPATDAGPEPKPKTGTEPPSAPKPHAEPETTAEPPSEVAAAPDAVAEAETPAEPGSRAAPKPSAEPETIAEPESPAAPDTVAESETNAAPDAESKADADPNVRAEPKPSAEPETIAEPESPAAPESPAEPDAPAEAQAQPEAGAEETASRPAAKPDHKPDPEPRPEG
jgi:hypothetical protein